MKILKTLNYIKLAIDLQEHPSIRPIPNAKDEGPTKSIFDDKSDSKDSIRKKWKSKKKNKGGIVYQLGIPVPVVDKDGI